MWAAAHGTLTRSNRFATRAIVATRKYESEARKPSSAPSGPAAAASEVTSATAAIASAARIGRSPVAKATTVRMRPEPAATSATRREIPEGPEEPEPATTAPVSAPRSVALSREGEP